MNETATKVVYEPLWIVKLFHMFPHLNMWFQQVNSTFDAYNPEYLETILFWSTIPILFLILLLLILILYACCLVCTSSSYNTNLAKKHQQASSSNKEVLKAKAALCRYKAFIIFAIILLSTSLGFIVYGSETFHYSYQELTHNINNFSAHFDKIGNDTLKIRDLVANELNSSVNQVSNELNSKQQLLNDGQIAKAKDEINSIRATLNESIQELSSLNQLLYERSAYKAVLREIDYVEQIRWSIMIGKVTINLLLILLLIVGLSKNSKGSLCFFAFIGVVALITIWVLNALYLGLSVFISDFCVNPEEYTIEIANHNNIKHMVVYFTKCPLNQQQYSPFQNNFNVVQRKFNTAHRMFKENLIPLSAKYIDWNKNNFSKIIEQSNRVLTQTFQSIRCDQTSITFKSIIRTLCFNSIFGLAIVLLSGLVFGLILPLLICIIPQLWRRIYSINFEQSEEANPFIPIAQTRTNISAARQYNESPNFQRLNHSQQQQQTLSNRHHHHDIHTDPYLKTSDNNPYNNHYHLSTNNYNNTPSNSAPIGSSNNTGAVVYPPYYIQQTGTQTRRTTATGM